MNEENYVNTPTTTSTSKLPKQIGNSQMVNKDKEGQNNKLSNQNLNNPTINEVKEKNIKSEQDEMFLQKIMNNFFIDLDKFNNSKVDNLSALQRLLRRKYETENNSYKISIMNTISKYSSIWKNFCLSFEEKLKSISDNKPVKSSDNINLYIEKIEKLNKYLKEKQEEITLLKGTLDKEMKFNKELQINISDLNKKLLNQKHSESQENQLYNNKQLLRDYNLLLTENKGLREELNTLNKDIASKKEKEVKIMKILFMLTKRGVPVEEMIGKEMLMSKDIAEEKSPEFILENSRMMNTDNFSATNENEILNPKGLAVPKINLQLNKNSKTDSMSVDNDEYSRNNLLVNLNPMEKELLKTYNNMGNKNVYDDTGSHSSYKKDFDTKSNYSDNKNSIYSEPDNQILSSNFCNQERSLGNSKITNNSNNTNNTNNYNKENQKTNKIHKFVAQKLNREGTPVNNQSQGNHKIIITKTKLSDKSPR